MRGTCPHCGELIVNPFFEKLKTIGNRYAFLIACRKCKKVIGAVNAD